MVCFWDFYMVTLVFNPTMDAKFCGSYTMLWPNIQCKQGLSQFINSLFLLTLFYSQMHTDTLTCAEMKTKIDKRRTKKNPGIHI